jgi:ribose 5-phosphate isomerase A
MLEILIYNCCQISNKFLMTAQQKKINAAKLAIKKIKPGMNLGLGTGSTANELIHLLGKDKNLAESLKCVSSSIQTEEIAKDYSIKFQQLDEFEFLDITIDGADEIDDNGNMIKGGGGALLREKMLANMSKEYFIIIDESKKVNTLGKFPLPIEIIPFSPKSTISLISKVFEEYQMTPEIILRLDSGGLNFITDGGNFIIDCYCKKILLTDQINVKIEKIPSVITTGLFLNMSSSMIIGYDEYATEINFNKK